MNSVLRKEMYYRNNLKNKYFKGRSDVNWNNYKRQRNKVNIRRTSIRTYFEKQCSHDSNGKKFWKTVKPFISDKGCSPGNIMLQENEELFSKKSDVEIYNKYYSTIADDIGENDNIENTTLNEVFEKHSLHPSTSIMSKCTTGEAFTFLPLTENNVYREMKLLQANKATGFDNMPPKIVKLCSSQLCHSFTKLLNNCRTHSCFPAEMKRAEVAPVFKKQDALLKKNNRPVNVLPTLSKLFEKLLETQLSDFFENIFNCLMSAYRKRYNCQDVLLKLVESWRHDLDNKNSVGSVMMDLSRAFDSMPRGLLLAKLRAYGVDINACKLLYSYLSNRRQRVKLCNTRSDWIATYRGFPQGSGIGPLLYNIFGNDLFYFINTCSLYNYADDNTLSYSHTDVNDLLHVLKTDCKVAIEWFTCNYMKANPDKFQVLFYHEQT